MDIVSKGQVPHQPDTARQRAVAPDACTAGNTDTSGNGGVFADKHIMRDLHLIIDFDTGFNNGVAQRPTVDATVGTDFDIIPDTHTANLWHFFPTVIAPGLAETVTANDSTGVQHYPVTQPGSREHGHARNQIAIFPDMNAVTDNTRGTYLTAGTDPDIRFDCAVRTYPGCTVDACRFIHAGRRVNTRAPRCTRMQQAYCPCIGDIRLISDKRRSRRLAGIRFGNNDG